jgi:molecular chaperone HscB
MSLDFSKNHFELFGLPAAFALDVTALDQRYRDIHREVHPDRFAAASDAEKRLAAQWATRINEAYRTLRSPLARGRYLLKINGIDTQEETNTAMPVAFLMEQMAWREAVIAAKADRDEAALDALAAQHRQAEKELIALLERQLASAESHQDAAVSVRKLRFIEKLGEEIELAVDSMDS